MSHFEIHSYYNFGRVHKTSRVTPAMEGLGEHVGSFEEIAALAE